MRLSRYRFGVAAHYLGYLLEGSSVGEVRCGQCYCREIYVRFYVMRILGFVGEGCQIRQVGMVGLTWGR